MKNFEGFWRMEPYPGQPEVSAIGHRNVAAQPLLLRPENFQVAHRKRMLWWLADQNVILHFLRR